ncbi:hypothetical protein CORC01_14425 [Colletotrichum orchidophilum]|uniref:Uncharacterized protein n=1 Tax=Colletotrichum orchidophilum TaxID=1209926 RepID=A0A1G4AM71_9PEZI|nr:uncharacterized protein CORC01_14425 [Colletotrichum orchidophilum]OHE90280.1 hypothetical protein CORC01_14425 [Colletotrichum orchidophilum]
MPSRMSIESLVESSLATQTLDETEAFREDLVGSHTPPADAMSPSTDIQCQQADMESYSGTTSHATAACSLLSPAKLTSSGLPTFNDVFSIRGRQSVDVASSSMALQEQMFSGCGNDRYAVNNASRSLAQAAAIRPFSFQQAIAIVDGMLDVVVVCSSQWSTAYRAAIAPRARVSKPGSLMNIWRMLLTLPIVPRTGGLTRAPVASVVSLSCNRALFFQTATTGV